MAQTIPCARCGRYFRTTDHPPAECRECRERTNLTGEYRRLYDADGWKIAWVQHGCKQHPEGCVPRTIAGKRYCFPLANYRVGEVVPLSILQ